MFLRLQVYEPLETERVLILMKSATRIQTMWRRHVDRKRFLRKRKAAQVLQHAFCGWRLRIKFIQMRRAAVVIQSHLRGMFAREVAIALREMRRVEEAEAKLRAEKEKQAQQEAEAAETLEEVSSISDQVNDIEALTALAIGDGSFVFFLCTGQYDRSSVAEFGRGK